MENSYNNSNKTNITVVGLELGDVVQWIIICLEVPLILLAICAVFSMVSKFGLIFINLLISDLIQLWSRITLMFDAENKAAKNTFFFGIMASVGFMVCVSLERYLAITKPMWYRSRQNIKISVAVVCVVLWMMPVPLTIYIYLTTNKRLADIFLGSYLLIPLPLFIFFLVGINKALSTAISVPAEDKRQIIAILVVVVVTYALMFVPHIINLLMEKYDIFDSIAGICVSINTLADSSIYIILKMKTMHK